MARETDPRDTPELDFGPPPDRTAGAASKPGGTEGKAAGDAPRRAVKGGGGKGAGAGAAKSGPAKAGAKRGAAKGAGRKAPAKAAGRGKGKGAAARAAGAGPFALRLTLLVAAITIAIDQFSKWLALYPLALAERHEIDVIDPWLNFRMAWNQGVNFGLFSSSVEIMRWLLIGVAVVVCIWIGVWVQRARPGRFARIAAGLLIGGALGNVIDRLAYGAVADFLNMSLPGWTNPYSFNVADIAIFAGAFGLVFQPQRDKPRDGTAKTG